jgi:hypothetical protein
VLEIHDAFLQGSSLDQEVPAKIAGAMAVTRNRPELGFTFFGGLDLGSDIAQNGKTDNA